MCDQETNADCIIEVASTLENRSPRCVHGDIRDDGVDKTTLFTY